MLKMQNGELSLPPKRLYVAKAYHSEPAACGRSTSATENASWQRFLSTRTSAKTLGWEFMQQKTRYFSSASTHASQALVAA